MGRVEEEKPRLQINWLQATGAALGATSSAVLLSTIGAAGTIIGAAVGSLFISVGGAIYTHSLRLSKRRMAMAQAAALARLHETRMAHTRAHAGPAGYHLSSTRIDLEPVGGEQEEAAAESPREPWRDMLAALPWKRIALVSLGLFLVAMLIITVFELATGRSVSSYTGGSDKNSSRTTIPGLGGGGSSSGPQPSPTPGQQASPGQGQASGQSTPTSGASPQSTPTPGAQSTQQQQGHQARPTPTPSATPTPTPTHSISPQPTPSGSAQPQ